MRIAGLLLLLLVPSLALADAAGDKGLANVDGAIARTTLFAEYEITNQEAGKQPRTLAATVRRKAGKAFVEFLAPADMKGTKILSQSATETYVYLPSFGKVRRMTTNIRESLFGMTIVADDLFGSGFAQRYTATQNGGRLTATPRAGASACAKLEIIVDQNWLPSMLTCTAANGNWTRLTRKAVKQGDAMSDDLFSKAKLQP